MNAQAGIIGGCALDEREYVEADDAKGACSTGENLIAAIVQAKKPRCDVHEHSYHCFLASFYNGQL